MKGVRSAGVSPPVRPSVAGPRARGKQPGRAGARKPSLNVVWWVRWAVGRRNRARSPREEKPLPGVGCPQRPVGTAEKGVRFSRNLPILPISQKRKDGERTREKECVLSAQLQCHCGSADSGKGLPAPAPLPAVARVSRGCRMKGARTRWRGVGRDWALRAQRGAEAPTASSPNRWGRGVVQCRGAEGRHT